MTNISSTSLAVSSYAPGRQDENLSYRPSQDSQSQLQRSDSSDKRPPPRFVYRGEVVEQLNNQDRRYRPQYNQDVDPKNRQAISSYQQNSEQGLASSGLPPGSGRIVDLFI